MIENMERFNMEMEVGGCGTCYGDMECIHKRKARHSESGVNFTEPKEPKLPSFKWPTFTKVMNELEKDMTKGQKEAVKEQAAINAAEVDGETAVKPYSYGTGYSPMKSYYDQGYLQPNHMTREERYPIIFDKAKRLQSNAKRILSFGCSTGEEAQALARRFPGAEIVGVDIDHESVKTARRNNKGNPLMAFQTDLGGLGKFDLVTCLNVFFCMEEPVPKDTLHRCLRDIDAHLNPGGLLMIYTSDHDPKEVLGDKYRDIQVWMREHNKNKKQYFNGYYRKRRWYHVF